MEIVAMKFEKYKQERKSLNYFETMWMNIMKLYQVLQFDNGLSVKVIMNIYCLIAHVYVCKGHYQNNCEPFLVGV